MTMRHRERDFTGQIGMSGRLSIDVAALTRNYTSLATSISPARLGAVIKADAYGLGAKEIALSLYRQDCRDFFVAHLVEALDVRPFLPSDGNLYVLNGLQPGDEETCADYGIVPVVNSFEQLAAWNEAAARTHRRLPAILQFDTGMSRLGIPPAEREAVHALVQYSDAIDVIFIMSHLANADEPHSMQNFDQLAEMERISAEYPGFEVCFANSGAAFLGKAYHRALVRTGIALYGGAPVTGRPNPMDAVVRLDVPVIQTRTVPAGTRVGYGGSHVAKSEMRLATIAAGYADGLPRSLSDKGAAFCDGIRLPIVGRVSMDSTTIDVTALPADRLKLGSMVEIIGSHQTLDELASDAGTISYEILVGLGTRFQRRYLPSITPSL